jgi:hypothetical protein
MGGVEILVQLMMGVGLAASAGFRAFLPTLAVGLLSRAGFLELNSSVEFLTRTDVLAILAVATVAEFLGDKIVVIDNLLDTVGTVIRPAAGALLASSVLLGLDPFMAALLGLATGGATSLAVQSGKAALRAGTTSLLPVHGGIGNALVSVVEDVVSFVGVVLAVFVPVLAFAFAVGLVVGGVVLLKKGISASRKMVSSSA